MNAMVPNLHQLWVYLAASPLLGLTTTLTVYLIGVYLHGRSRFNPMVDPLLITVVILGMLLIVTDTPYKAYFDGAQFVYFLLGPATTVLAVLLFQQQVKLRRHAVSLMAGLLAGSVVAVVSAVGIVWLLGASPETLHSMVSKSMTIPITMDISEKIGGTPTTMAILVLIAGTAGTATTTRLLNLLRTCERSVRGFATGTAVRGIGTVRAFQVSLGASTFSTLGMGLSGVLTAVLVPLLMGQTPH